VPEYTGMSAIGWPGSVPHPSRKPVQEFSGALVVVVASEGLIRVADRESSGTGGDCEGDSKEYEDLFHGRILSKSQFEPYHTPVSAFEGKAHMG
jgi:hypothetical protein